MLRIKNTTKFPLAFENEIILPYKTKDFNIGRNSNVISLEANKIIQAFDVPDKTPVEVAQENNRKKNLRQISSDETEPS